MTCTHGEKFGALPDLRGALCAGHPVLAAAAWDLLVDGETWAQRQGRRAMAAQVCAVCPVREACLQAALVESEPCGVWAGWLFNPRMGVAVPIAVDSRKVQVAGGVDTGNLGFSVHENPYAA